MKGRNLSKAGFILAMTVLGTMGPCAGRWDFLRRAGPLQSLDGGAMILGFTLLNELKS